jgi:hypothetical protein
LTETPDGKALFVNIQHPGEDTAAASIATPMSAIGPRGARRRRGTFPRPAPAGIRRGCDEGGPKEMDPAPQEACTLR